ncbi:MAG: hypothetical protein ACHQF4_00450 [Sphingobacteriales bacterium]
MRKILCMIALGAISFGSVMAAAPIKVANHAMQTDTTTKVKKKKIKTKAGHSKMKVKMKDTTQKM